MSSPPLSRVTLSSGPFSVDELAFLEGAPARVLAAVSRGEIDLNLIARQELARRGLDEAGAWVGHREADALYRDQRNQSPESIG